MKRTLLIIITAAALLLAACQNTIRYEYDINDGKITLLGQLSSVDSVHSVFLSMSYPDRIDSLADATVSCYVNGERHQASKVHPGYQEQYDIITQEITMVPRENRYTEYRFQAGFKPGDDVRIEASKGDMKAWVELEVPQPGKIVSVDTVTVVKKWSYQDIDGTDTYEQEYVEFTIRLKDAEGTDSYFTLDAVMAEVTKLFSGELITETLQSAGRLDYETFHDLILEDGYSSGIGDMFEDLLPVNSTHCFSDKMFQDGEVVMDMSYGPFTVASGIADGTLPETCQTFVFDNGTIGNTNYMAIAFDAPNKAGAMVAINAIIGGDLQLTQYSQLRDLPVVDQDKLSDEEKAAFDAVDLGKGVLSQSELLTHRLPEMPADLVPVIEEIWAEEVVGK